MPAIKISVTVDGDVLEEVRHLAGREKQLSAIVADALKDELYRLRALATIREMLREDPPTPEERKGGENLWREIKSSFWTPEPCRRRRKGSKNWA